MRIDEKSEPGLPAGQWAELRERITHGQDKEIIRARQRVKADPTGAAHDDQTVALQVFVRDWHVLDVDGNPLDVNQPDVMDRCPMDVADVLFAHIMTLYTRTTVPNSPTPPSSGGSSSGTR